MNDYDDIREFQRWVERKSIEILGIPKELMKTQQELDNEMMI